jgi:hypothetical protein
LLSSPDNSDFDEYGNPINDGYGGGSKDSYGGYGGGAGLSLQEKRARNGLNTPYLKTYVLHSLIPKDDQEQAVI